MENKDMLDLALMLLGVGIFWRLTMMGSVKTVFLLGFLIPVVVMIAWVTTNNFELAKKEFLAVSQEFDSFLDDLKLKNLQKKWEGFLS